jgi:tripartite-type tricarboxylate transporter receptor subunit TctC
MTVAPVLQARLSYDPLADFKPLGLAATVPMVLVAHPAAGIESMSDLVKAARAKPGGIDYASYGVGTSHHIAMERLMLVTGIKLNHIPYGTTLAQQDVIAGTVPLMWTALSTAGAVPSIQARKLIPLAVAGASRYSQLPQVPTVAESGYPGFESSPWLGLVAPAQTPGAVVEKISADLEAVTRSPAYRERVLAVGLEPRSSTAEAFAAFLRTDSGRTRSLLASVPKQ